MSEKLNRGTPVRPDYRSMKTEALEELLRQDCEASSENTDTDALLCVMEVLAERRKQNDSTGKTAQESWKSFQRNYPRENGHSSWLRRAVAAAAVFVLLAAIPLAAKAFGWEDIWNAVAHWAKETFSFVSDAGTQLTEPAQDMEEGRRSLQELLATQVDVDALLPSYIPDGYRFHEIVVDETPVQKVYVAMYLNGNKLLKIAVQSYLEEDQELAEINENLLEIYDAGGLACYIFQNNRQLLAAWVKDTYMCYISGELDIHEIKAMVDSIGKG